MKRINILTIIIFFMAIFHISKVSAVVINAQGEVNSVVTAYITKRMKGLSGTKNLTYKMFLPQSVTEGINTQSISALRETFTPNPTELNEFTDEYGNNFLELVWNREIKIIQIDLQFKASLYSSFNSLTSDSPFPLVIEDSQKIFLTSTELSPSNNLFINYIGRTISHNLQREIDVVNSTFLWLDRNISLTNNSERRDRYDALSVLKEREGTEKGISNLAVALFKGMGIPSRVVYGISFQREIELNTEREVYIYDFPNDERYWVEIFFRDIGWVSYDPYGIYFGSSSHLIRFSVGPDSDYASEKWGVEKGEIDLLKEFIYDVNTDSSSLVFKDFVIQDVNKLILSPEIPGVQYYSEEPDLNIEGIRFEKRQEDPGVGTKGMIVHNSDISQKLDVVATRKRVYAQKFTINFPITLTEIKLPLHKFSDEGKIWIEVYADTEGKPGELLLRTDSISSKRVRYMMIDNPWLSFPVPEKNPSYLKEGSYWIALRSSGSCIFNWHAFDGNVVGDKNDTRFMDISLKKPHWNSIVNIDMNFQIIGKREE